MLKNLRRRQLRHEAGQALALLAVALPIFFVIALVVVDGSQGFVAKRQMQNAADAASLAAAREVVPALDATCQSSQPCFTGTLANVGAKAGEYAVMNGLSPSDAITAPSGPPCNPSLPVFTPANCALPPCDATRATNCFTWPYPSDTAPGTPRATVEVRLQVTVSTFFTKVARISPNFLKASARAVATASGASTPHCSFPGQPRIADPDHWAPSCRIPGDPAGGLGAVAFTKSPDCSGDPSYTSPPDGASIQMTGAPSNLKALMSNGGIITSGNANKFSDHVALGRYSESSPGVPHCVDLWGSNTSPNFPDVHAITPFADYPVPPPSPAPPATGCNVIGSLSTVTERARSSNVATLTTRARHGLSVGMTVAVAGLSPSQFNRTAVVTAVPDATHFSYANAGANVALASSNGTATYDPDGAFGSGTFTFNHATHPTGGVYCVFGDTPTLTLAVGQNNGVFDGYTFFAPAISVSSGSQTFVGAAPASGQRRVVFDAYLGDFSISGNSNTITGDIYAPNGNISLSGGGASTGNGGDGFMESLKLIVAGNYANFNGTGPVIFQHCDFLPEVGTVNNEDQYLLSGCVIQGNPSNSVTLTGLGMTE